MARNSIIRNTKVILIGLSLFAFLLTPFSVTYAQATSTATTTSTGSAVGAVTDALCALNPSNPVCLAAVGASVATKAVSAGETIAKCVGTGLIDCAITGVGTAILKISTFFLGIAGTLFNLVMVKTVFEFSQLIGNAPGLLLAWGILRDLGNMALLFGFIFMGLATILDLHTYNAKKALPPLIIFAVLMNFSLFAAESIIDTSNVFSTIMYSQANTSPCGFSGTIDATGTVGGSDALAAATSSDADCAVNYGIAGSIMQTSGLSTMFKVQDGLGTQDIVVYLGLSLFAFIGAIVMFAASIMLIIRAITLTFLMVFAPIGFAGMAIPPLRGLANKWWNQLIHQSFFAPILLLLILISLKVTEGLGGVSGGGLAGAMLAPGTSTMGVILIFVIVIGFLIGSLRAASSFGAIGASFAISTAKSIVRAPLGAASSFVGRNTVGLGAARAQKFYESRLGHNPIISRNILGIDSGIAGVFSAAQNSKFGGSTSYKANEEHHKARHEEFDKASRKAETKANLDRALAMPTTNDAEIQARNDEIAEIAQRMSVKEAEEILKAMKKESDRDAFAQNLSAEKFAGVVKDTSSLTDSQKSQAKTARFKNLATQRDIINDPTTSAAQKDAARKEIRQYSAKDLQNATPELLSDDTIMRTLSDSQRDDLIKSNEVNPATTRKLRTFDPVERIKTDFASGTPTHPAGGGAAVAGAVAALKPKKVAKLSDEVLSSDEVADILTPDMLQAITTDGDLSTTSKAAIVARLARRRDPSMVNWLASPGGLLWK